jgi:hypothetical protein
MATITLDAIRAASDIPTEAVPVPEWGADAVVTVRGITKGQADAIFEACKVDGEPDKDGKPSQVLDPKKLQDELFLACVVDPKFERADLDMLAEKANAPVNRIQMACVRVAGLAPEALKQAKSEAAQSA